MKSKSLADQVQIEISFVENDQKIKNAEDNDQKMSAPKMDAKFGRRKKNKTLRAHEPE